MQAPPLPTGISFLAASSASQPLQPTPRRSSDTEIKVDEEANSDARALLAIRSRRPVSLRTQLSERRRSLDSLWKNDHNPIELAINHGSWRALGVIIEAGDNPSQKPGPAPQAVQKNQPAKLQRKALLPKQQAAKQTARKANESTSKPTTEPQWCAAVFEAIRGNQAKTLRALLEGQTNALPRLTHNNNSPLTMALALPLKWDALMVLIDQMPGLCNIDAPFSKVQVPNRFLLHEAVCRGDHTAIKTLLRRGSSPDLRLDEESPTALHLAAEHLHPRIVSSLIKKQADVTLQDANRTTALVHAVRATVKQPGSMKRTVSALLEAGVKQSLRQQDIEMPLQELNRHLGRVQQELATAGVLYKEHCNRPWTFSRTERDAHHKHWEALRLEEKEMKDTAAILQRYTRMILKPMPGRW